MFRCLLFLFSLCLLTRTASPIRTPCHDSERLALLQFKESFLINESVFVSAEPSAYPKVQQWKPDNQGNGDCCKWDGVECDDNTGHVVGLDLSSSFLYGSIDANSSLFHLVHLRSLNLSDNNFNGSRIPAAIANLSRLSQLNLSFSLFSGQIPSQVLKLSKLVILHLSENELELRSPGLRNLVEKLTNLKELHLSGVNISSTVPQILGNLSSLTFLSLQDCSLHGELPPAIFQLPNLQVLNLRNNPYLTGKFPELNRSSLVEKLLLANTSFSGELPESIGTLNFLSYFDISFCYFFGPLPSSIGELTKIDYMDLSYNLFSGQIPSSLANLSQLTYLSLSSHNSFSPGTLSWLGKQTKLTVLGLRHVNLHGEISCSLENLTQLTTLKLRANELTGSIPFWLGNLTQLTLLDLGINKLQGQIPESIFNLVNIRVLLLDTNDLNGTLKLDSFLNLKNLNELQLSDNYLSLLTNTTINGTVPKFSNLGLGICNLSEFPDFLREQDKLEILELGGNKIHGQIPKWVWEMSKESLSYLGLSGNFLTGFDQPILPLINLGVLLLDSNKLQGSIPIPPPFIFYFSVSNNSLTGEFSPLLCNLSSLALFDLSSNNFSGLLPQCLANLSESLVVLNLRNNNFVGPIPQLCMKGSKLRMIDLNQNQFQGQLPRSLANCEMVENLNMGNNQLIDTFPFWLGKLPELRILILRGNQFHGTIEEQGGNFEFLKLQIIDLSFNRFTGNLPSQQFQNWIAMKVAYVANLSYLQANRGLLKQNYYLDYHIPYSVTITSKGMETHYEKIQELLVAIDFSSNNFEGCIPENIGSLQALRLLNLSNNVLSCHIPPSLGNLSNLESLDLSHNSLSGKIPTELLQLTFLEFFNVSYNYLKGQVPQEKQFATFENNSFGSNPGLCGKPLSKTCTSFQVSPPPLSSEEDQGRKPLLEFGWKIILLGYGSGMVIGLSIGYIYTPNKNEWFMKCVRRLQQKRRATWSRNKCF